MWMTVLYYLSFQNYRKSFQILAQKRCSNAMSRFHFGKWNRIGQLQRQHFLGERNKGKDLLFGVLQC